jgi:uncharacterized membrane protein
VTDRRLRVAVAAISSLGIAVAGYLTYVRFAGSAVVCPTGGCATVQNSEYADVFGIPVALLGLGAYLAVLATALSGSDAARALGAAVAGAGAAIAIYLVYLQAAVIGAFCTWCLANDAIVVVLAVAAALRLRPSPHPDRGDAPMAGGAGSERMPAWNDSSSPPA